MIFLSLSLSDFPSCGDTYLLIQRSPVPLYMSILYVLLYFMALVLIPWLVHDQIGPAIYGGNKQS